MKIAIIGATGLVGEKMVEIAVRKNIDATLFASKNSVGKIVTIGEKTFTIHDTDELTTLKPDYALLATNAVESKQLVPMLTQNGTTCIDNSSAFRTEHFVPLVVPSVNASDIGKSKLVANPNCTTIQIATALSTLKPLGITKVTAVTYQSASGMGKQGLAELYAPNAKSKVFPHILTDNLIPAIGEFTPDGYTTEEHKVMDECRKILHLPLLKINCFAVRVPVSVCHGAFLNVELKKHFTLADIENLLNTNNTIALANDNTRNIYPMPKDLRGSNLVSVGRLTKDKTANAVNMFVVADNLIRGASGNAWETLETIWQMRGENV